MRSRAEEAFGAGRYLDAARLIVDIGAARTRLDRIKQRVAFHRADIAGVSEDRSRAGPKPIRLGDRWAAMLLDHPETGKGHWRATVTLNAGRRYEKVTIFDGFMRGLSYEAGDDIAHDDIASIKVTFGKSND